MSFQCMSVTKTSEDLGVLNHGEMLKSSLSSPQWFSQNLVINEDWMISSTPILREISNEVNDPRRSCTCSSFDLFQPVAKIL